jgi:tetratricopeptide (TPR) repeat protein
VAHEAQHIGEFLKWLCPSSYWRVQGLLSSFRGERSEGTLNWALNLSEFRAWRLADLHSGSNRRVTWIKGALGLGKSIMAAYYVDLLKAQYRNAVVAYFFCRSKEPGLTTALDILRTLAYQCSQDNKSARTTLEKLKSEGFQINADLGIRYLFEKLLLEPLKSVQEIYVVLDGLDEADDLTLDRTDPAGRPDLHVLLECLASIPSLRLLCISRPSAKIQTIIPNTFARTISKSDNANDIDTYVRTKVEKSRNLQLLFKQDPVQYFREHGEGVFLWVKLVLQQLEKAKTASAFQNYLKGFSAASEVTDKIENLYRTILSRISGDDKKWVFEIIRWIFVAKDPLSIGTLQALVEWCRDDQMVNFGDFIDETCGSLLQFLPQPEGTDDLVELVHETFKSFIADPKVCPSSFVIDKPKAECDAALQCLKCLTSGTAPKEVCEYASTYWVEHLSMATAIQSKTDVLVALYGFFASDALKFWIKRNCQTEIREFDFTIDLPLEEIRRCLVYCTLSTDEYATAALVCTDLEIERAMNWQRVCLDSSFLLKETVGKAAVTLWLHESLDQPHTVIACFLLGLKYYWRRGNRTRSNLEELDELIATKFQDLSAWANPTGPSVPVVHGNLGLAFYAVLEFDKCLQNLRDEKPIYEMDKQLLPYVAASLFAIGDYDGIIEEFDSRICDTSRLVLKAYQINGDFDRAITVFEAAHKRDPLSEVTWRSLFSVYQARGDVDKLIAMAKLVTVADTNAFRWECCRYLYNASCQKGSYEDAIHTYESITNENPKDVTGGAYLAQSYAAIGDYDRAIDTLESALLENPKDFRLSSVLVSVVSEKGHDPQAAQRLKRSLEKGDIDRGVAVRGLVEVYRKFGTEKESIAEFKQIAQKYPFDAEIVYILCEAYIEAGEYEEAISLSMSRLTMDDLAVGSQYLRLIFENLCEACRAKGDHTVAIQLFESKAKITNYPYTLRSSALLDLYDGNHNSARGKELFQAIVRTDNFGVSAWPGLLRVTAGDPDFDSIVQRMETLIDDGQMEASEDIAFELMNAYYARGDYSKAIAKLTKISYSLPLSSWPWHILAEMYRRIGHPEEAIKVYETKFRRLPTDWSLYQPLASLYLITSNYLRVIECYEAIQAVATVSKSFDSPILLAAYYTSLKIFARDSVRIDEWFRERFLWYPVSEVHKRNGDNHRAHQIYETVIDVYQKAVYEENRRSLRFICWPTLKADPRHARVNNVSVGYFKLPKYAILCALGEVYKTKQAIKLALETSAEITAVKFLH